MLGSRPRAPTHVIGRRVTNAVCVVVLSLTASSARAEDPDSAATLARARKAIEAVDYETAIATVRPLLASPSARVRVHALEITAVARLLGGRQVQGREAVDQLYALSPAFLLDDPTLPPRVTSEFEAAAAQPRPRGVTPIVAQVESDALGFEIQAAGATRQVVVACRTAPGEPFVEVRTRPTSGGFRFTLPRAMPTACHAVAFDEGGVAIGRLGTAKNPFELRPHATNTSRHTTSTDRPAITTRWWFWTGVAGVLAGGAALTYVLTRPSDPSLPRSEVTISTLPAATVSWGTWRAW